MKIFHYTIILLAILIAGSCSKDLGNYEYKDINELSITGVNSTYNMRKGYDTLRINPKINASMDEGDTSRYDYYWILSKGVRLTDTIGRKKQLNYPVLLNPANYPLFYKVVDKKTGVVWRANSTLNVSTPVARGLLIIGEDEQGYAEAEMLAMLNDTLHIKHILSKSGLPRLREPVSFIHTGNGSSDADIKLWVFTKTGSYFLDRGELTGTTANNFSRLLYISDVINSETLHPISFAPQVITAAGAPTSPLYRAIITKGGDVFASFLLINGGDLYTNPINRLSTAQQVRIPAAPYLIYSIGNMNSVMWYDTINQRFLNYASFGLGTASVVLSDEKDKDGNEPIFPWNNAALGRTLVYAENTRNTDLGSTNGNSFAIMKDGANAHYVYKFYASGGAPARRAAYKINPMAVDFDKADFYAFSSNRTVIFYSVGNKLYAYDYNPNNERFYQYAETGGDQITMLKFDTQIDHVTNSLYIATYNSNTKGTLRRFRVGTNPNVVELLPQVNSTWTDLVKVKNINWRAVN